MDTIIKLLKSKSISFDDGLTDQEIIKIERKFDIKFPPDLKEFLQLGLPISDSFVNWRQGLISKHEADSIKLRLDWPLEGMLFDLQYNDFWIKDWGDMPESYLEKERIARDKYLNIPKFIPIYSHRYIPMEPLEAGNPVFSVYQMDIIYYGYDLATYFANEFYFTLPNDYKMAKEPKKIPFWSDWVEQ